MENQIILKDSQSEYFELISYPDGQHSVKLYLDKLNIKDSVDIKCRIKTFSELEVLGCLCAALRQNGFHINKIEFVYLFGARSDRSFRVGEPNYFRDVIRPILESYKAYSLYILWPFKPLCVINFSFPGEIFFDDNITNEYHCSLSRRNGQKIGGDKTSKEMLPKYPDSELYFDKIRTDCGINVCLSDFASARMDNYIINYEIYNFFIVDDLCDGGATFIAEAKYLKERFPDIKLKLFVYHGLFTKGLDVLLEYFDEIICTNSYQDIDHPRVKQIKVI